MAKRRFQLTETDKQAFEQAEGQTRDACALRRLQALRLYGTGTPMPDLQRLLPVSDRRLREWSQKYRQAGLAGLKSQWQAENALKLSREQRVDVQQRLQHYRPEQVMAADVRLSQGQFWTVSDLQIGVKSGDAVEYRTPGWYRTLLHECGLSYQRTEKVYRSRPAAHSVADFEAELEKK